MAFTAVAGAVTGVIDQVKQFAADAEAAQVTDAKLNTSLKDNVPNWQAYSGAIDAAVVSGNKFGFTDNQIKDSLAQLVTHTHSVTDAVGLQAGAMDLARLKGIDLDTATKILGKVYDGNTSILTRYGIAVAKGSTATQALAAIQKAAGGQALAYSQTQKGAQDALDAEAEHLRVRLGTTLLGPMQAFTHFLANDVMNAITGVIDGIGSIGTAFDNLHRFIDPAYAATQDETKAMEDQAIAMGLTKKQADDYIAAMLAAKQAQIDATTVTVTGTTGVRASGQAAALAAPAFSSFGGAVSDATDAAKLAAPAFSVTGGALAATLPAVAGVAGGFRDLTAAAPPAAAATTKVTSAGMAYLTALKAVQDTQAAVAAASGRATGSIADSTTTHLTQANVAAEAWARGYQIKANQVDAANAKMVGSFSAMGKNISTMLGPKGSMVKDAQAGMDAMQWAIDHPGAWKKTRDALEKDMRDAQAAMAKAVKQGKPEVIGAIQAQMDYIATLEGQLPSFASKWGKGISANLATGIWSNIGQVQAAAKALAAMIAAHVQLHSPAKMGPLSEGGGPEGWGRRFGSLYLKGAASSLAGMGAMLGGGGILSPMLALAGGGSQTVHHTFDPIRVELGPQTVAAVRSAGGSWSDVGAVARAASGMSSPDAHLRFTSPRRY